LAATRALQALHPWMEAHVHEVVEEFYGHLWRFEQPRWLLADPQRLAHVKAAQIDSLLSFTAGHFDMAFVAGRLAIGRIHARGRHSATVFGCLQHLRAYSLPQDPGALSGLTADGGSDH
jgi:hypothetical protein